MTLSTDTGSDQPLADDREAVSCCPFCLSSIANPGVLAVEDYFFASRSSASDFLRCADCGSLWQPQRLTPGPLAASYSAYYTHEMDAGTGSGGGVKDMLRAAYVRVRFGGSTKPADRLLALAHAKLAPNLDQLEARLRFVPQAPAAVLDYGCGNGAYLLKLKSLGYEVSGVDFDPTAIATASASGIQVLTPEAALCEKWHSRFDAITLSHVIEHVPDPRALLEQLHGWLKPGGLLYVECPNAEAAGLEVFGRYWRGLEAPRHLAIPSHAGLRQALGTAGFDDMQQTVIGHIRPLVWARSMDVVPEEAKPSINQLWQSAPAEIDANAEYLAISALKPK